MANFIQKIVSGPKQRFKDAEIGTDLDLSYISDNIIIMGYPASDIEALYRNNKDHVKTFLESRHGRKWRIYNFCPCYENSYDPSYFYHQVVRYPYPDHHVSPLPLITLAVRDMSAFLEEDDDNVVVIHCKAGKGRSGTMACCLLLSLPGELPQPSKHISKLPRPTPELKKPHKYAQSDREALVAQKLVAPAVVPSPASSTSHLTTNANGNVQNTKTAIEKAQEVMNLHTHRRMKTKANNNEDQSKKDVSKWRKGVSIPSQRRWIQYFAHATTKVDPPKFIPSDVAWGDGGGFETGKRFINITKVTVRMKETWGTFSKLVNIANGTDVSIHFAKYDDTFVQNLQEVVKDDHNKFKMFEDDKWDNKKMVNRFAEIDESSKEIQEDDVQIRTFIPSGKLTLDGDRECRLRIVYGQVSVGWLWFVPSFHIFPLTVKNEDIDFTKGASVGVSLIDVKVEGEIV